MHGLPSTTYRCNSAFSLASPSSRLPLLPKSVTLGHALVSYTVPTATTASGVSVLRVVVPGGGVRNASVLLASRATISSTFSAVAGSGSK